jgi:hypothetical protein
VGKCRCDDGARLKLPVIHDVVTHDQTHYRTDEAEDRPYDKEFYLRI